MIVVDDGSTDGTAALAAEFVGSERVLRLSTNSGKGAAVKAGMLLATGSYCLFADADGATPISEEKKLRGRLDAGAAISIGSRATGGTRRYVGTRPTSGVAPLWTVRFHRHVLGRTFSFLIRTIVGLPYQDTQCGFKMFRGSIVRPLWSGLKTSGFAFDVELLLRAKELNLRVEEIGVRWEEKSGSKVNVAIDSFRMLKEIFMMRARRAREAFAYGLPFLAPAARKKS